MLPVTSPRKKIRSPIIDSSINLKTSVTCSNVPEGLFDANAAKKHFNKFGRVQKIRLLPKRHMCIIEYDQPISAERAVLNAGAFEGFMFDVTRTKARVRRKSKKEDDPDWVPDSDVEEELSAMAGAPTYRTTRQKPMEIEPVERKVKTPLKIVKQSKIIRKNVAVAERKPAPSTSVKDSPVAVTISQTNMSTYEAAAELHQLLSKVSLTPDEQWRILDARDRILRAWGGAGSRIKVNGATIGTCPDMCPEKELLHRQAEHQVMTLETIVDSDGELEPWRAVKQYSRSSADQEMPMCYELRPAKVLMRTCAYLLHEIADTTRQVTLADWFHFMWDRLRSIRKDITQQALCCSESIRLVEMCARFHAHCAARLADLEHTQFDQKLNTDNLTKCLQTLKHMYADVGPDQKPREAEFRGYIALLNLGDANFWWEIKQLPHHIQKSEPITFALKVFNALDNNNYVRFFRLVKEKATYLQACILLRYFNDVRARALARIVKAYAPRGGSRFPAQDLMNALAFESVENMKSFINHYGLRFGKTDDTELTVILDRNQFIEDSDPYPLARAVKLIESKRQSMVGEVIAGGELPNINYQCHVLYSSFTKDGKLKESALIADDQGYNTMNDSNKDVRGLKAEIQRLEQSGKSIGQIKADPVVTVFAKPETKFSLPTSVSFESKLFSFKPAIPVAPTEIIHNSPEKIFAPDAKNVFLFSKPEDSTSKEFVHNRTAYNNATTSGQNLFGPIHDSNSAKNVFMQPMQNEANKNIFGTAKKEGLITSQVAAKSIFGQTNVDTKAQDIQKSLFRNTQIKNIFSKIDGEPSGGQNVFGKSIFGSNKDSNLFLKSDSTVKIENGSNIFSKPSLIKDEEATKPSSNIFGSIKKPSELEEISQHTVFTPNKIDKKLSPSSLFKSVCNPPNGSDTTNYSIFQSKNKSQSVANNIFNSVGNAKGTVYEFDQSEDLKQAELHHLNEERIKEEERKAQEKLKRDEEKLKREEEKQKEELRRREQLKRKEEERKKQEELKLLEEKRKAEEKRKQEELRKKLEEERQAEIKRKAEEEEKKFKAAVDKESTKLIEELTDDINNETIFSILKEEVENLNNLRNFARNVTDSVIDEICGEICTSEIKAEIFRTEKVMRKWFRVWHENYIRNCKRRNLLDDTPVWLPNNNPDEEAAHLRRLVENTALKNMNAFHRGYHFVGELKQIPPPEPYNIMEIIKSPLLKRMKTINHPYDKCFFWKITLVSPGETKWLYRKINLEKWLFDAFSDKKNHDVSETLIHVSKQSWNHLMDFAISVSFTNSCIFKNTDAVEGSNGFLFYFNENDVNEEMKLLNNIQEMLNSKYPYQLIPISVIMPKLQNTILNNLETYLVNCVKNNQIVAYRLYVLDDKNIADSLNASTKSALKWMAKNYPQNPPIEIDYLKSICQRYLGNEIWHRFKSERDQRINTIFKDLEKLVQLYNTAVDKLTEVITDEDLFNYPSFPLEFKPFLDSTSPYPKPYEFIPSNVKNSGNVSAIKDAMNQLKLPKPVVRWNPENIVNMQKQIRTYSNQIGWFEDPEQVVCKVIAKMPNEFTDLSMSSADFSNIFINYNIMDFLNVIVYEKIASLKHFDKCYAVYKRSVLDTYRNADWLFQINLVSDIKHKALEYEDEIDFFIEAKRRKIAMDSMEQLMLEDKDSTLVEENIKMADISISKYSNCTEAMKELEMQLEEGKKKSIEFENLLKAALSEVHFNN